MAKKTKVDEDLVRKLADLLKENDLNELEIETKDMRVRVSLGGGQPIHQVTVPTGGSVAAPLHSPSDSGDTAAPAPEDDPNAVKSPMVGTAYLAPEPGAAPFVQVGDNIKLGQTLMIIEAMKVMNPIPAPKAGVVKEILVQDAQPVEFGDALLIIE